MRKNGFSLIGIFFIISVLIITVSGTIVWKKKVAPTSSPILITTPTQKSGLSRTNKLIYKANKDMCGEIVFVEKLGESFNSALEKLTTQKKEVFSKWCLDNPDQPCREVIIETKKTQEVRDLSNNLVDIDLYFITVKDKNTGFKVHAISEAIDANGNLYNLNWCPD